MPAHLLLRLEAPLMSFGTTAVDHRRPVQAWPAVSMLTGLLANALGWERSDNVALDRLQARIRWAARIDRPGTLLNDFQTAQLGKDDRGWTTRGVVETRGGGDAAYNSPHLRYRDYRADASVLVALRLEPETEPPTLADLAAALDTPKRPLFLGRKGCLPATRISRGILEAADAVEALDQAPAIPDGEVPSAAAVYFNVGAAEVMPQHRVHQTSDERRFSLDVHAGRQQVFERVRKVTP
ncbi:type I-E CRISPR-associated protein Cas5/CasD [Ideonella dechloratans]|uniref:Type I-E CRISPR-associated protein Cas5/CasD n=1 Tax=Ideonella dechloratans TaxID=36863 RepID=A0A643FGB3_IDEDE|nr:type I-E CRISPR-associated protein Cas5/CasD [Ideonella dechloratans]KAB0583219.1 type I-E CRISPR-associated protein Cas5/CasD [Ideonella dechloratans]UFU10598.1 type I-E CRISPR-associated protein Cas5/CasD [Ideonella dechloratans]